MGGFYALSRKLPNHFIVATEYHLGTLKAKVAKYRGQLLEPSGKKGDKGEGFDVLKSGDARGVMIGFPSVGKVGFNNYGFPTALKFNLKVFCL